MTGSSIVIASKTAVPEVSLKLGKEKTSARANSCSISVWLTSPVKTIRSEQSIRPTSSFKQSARGPSPTMRSSVFEVSWACFSKARIRSNTPFRPSSRPANRKTT
nr:hypothetical protein [uncultured bacterium]